MPCVQSRWAAEPKGPVLDCYTHYYLRYGMVLWEESIVTLPSRRYRYLDVYTAEETVTGEARGCDLLPAGVCVLLVDL